MTKDCKTCIYKEGSCYPSLTIFDKDKTCKSYEPDYEGYIAELEKENADLEKKNAKLESDFRICEKNADTYYDQLNKAKEIIRTFLNMPMPNNEEVFADVGIFLTKAEQFLKEIEK